ncbi:MAG: tryptophan--tRNA ligase [Planctomycetota bacterium]
MDRILSGIQPTGSFHLGNYLGAIKNWVDLQNRGDFECFYCIVDLHALTLRPSADELRGQVASMAVALLASGLDPERSVLFVQSAVPEHAELCWILGCMTQLGDLNRMTQFKDKAEQGVELANAGLYSYPVLQAADITLYRASHVPVGEDQEQHLELTREIVRRFHHHYGRIFPEPRVVRSHAPRVIGLDGAKKMSKSLGNHIGVLEDPGAIMKKLRGAKTDPQRLRRNDPGRPEVCNIWSLHRFFTDEDTQGEIHEGCTTAAIGCVECKKILCRGITAVTEPIRARAGTLEKRPDTIRDVLYKGNSKASEEARMTMDLVRRETGLWHE